MELSPPGVLQLGVGEGAVTRLGLVVVDFAVRHGFVSPDEPGFVEIIHLLRAGGFGTE